MSIKPIDKTSVHRICSGQVILDLATAVKELVENSLDAGATSVEVRLKEYGAELIEVLDNGSGIAPEDFASLALKHYTSKITAFEDLNRVASFGFRGEALSSLCAMGKLCVTTCTEKTDPAGVRLEYDSRGNLVGNGSVARSRGTTVTLSNVFESLPVRHREFKRNLKREYARCLDVVQAYALISEGVRISCSNQVGKGERSKVVSTQGNKHLRDNIANVFGTKIVSQLVDVSFELSEEVNGDDEGPVPQCGRNSADRQYYYINKRPCDLPKISKAVNETYREIHSHQYPIVIFNFIIDTEAYDVNVTPDKRTILLHNEKIIIEALKASTYATQTTVSSGFEAAISQNSLKRSRSSSMVEDEVTMTESPGEVDGPVSDEEVDGIEESGEIMPELRDSPAVVGEETRAVGEESQEIVADVPGSRPDPSTPARAQPTMSTFIGQFKSAAPRRSFGQGKSVGVPSNRKSSHHLPQRISKPSILPPLPYKSLKTPTPTTTNPLKFLSDIQEDTFAPIDLPSIRTNQPHRRRHHSRHRPPTPSSQTFKLGLSPAEDAQAVEELTRNIRKEDFARMEVLGQFNLGFIVARLEDDLFIIDQHASSIRAHTPFLGWENSDEKYNYENFKRTMKVDSQRLIRPLALDLTPQQELTATEHTAILKKNGFDLSLDPSAPPTKRVRLISLPQSRTVSFGVDDLEELLHKLSDDSTASGPGGDDVRCSRLMALWASKACRSSVMVGDALDMGQMRKIVRHMGEMEQPWVSLAWRRVI
ncbi:Mismatch repair endonuclease pms2 [Borealophlyctis nickersoniae]|nr:Mismatch repair endonuclease pms2 [Borealophlyctis nickersoniae]